MSLELTRQNRVAGDNDTSDSNEPFVSDESIALRNYDGTDTYDITVHFVDVDGEITARDTYTLSPLTVRSACVRLPRGIYRVDVYLNGDRRDSAECLIGSGPDELALVEIGNGIVSVVESIL